MGLAGLDVTGLLILPANSRPEWPQRQGDGRRRASRSAGVKPYNNDLDLKARVVAAHPDTCVSCRLRRFRPVRMAVEGSHLVAGFGRILDLPAAALRPGGATLR
jgi:hypothetical protein